MMRCLEQGQVNTVLIPTALEKPELGYKILEYEGTTRVTDETREHDPVLSTCRQYLILLPTVGFCYLHESLAKRCLTCLSEPSAFGHI